MDHYQGSNRNIKLDSRRLSCSYKIRDDGLVEIYDLDFAAYCVRVRGEALLELLAGSSMPNSGISSLDHSTFVFNLTKKRVAQLSIDYNNSESSRHADGVRTLKKAIRSSTFRGA